MRETTTARHEVAYAAPVTRREWLAGMAIVAAGDWRAAASTATTAQPPADDPTSLSIGALASAFASGALTPLDVTAAYLRRIDAENGALNALVTVTRDRALDDTRRLMARGAAGLASAPLAGVPIVHKDLLPTRGIRTTGGSRLYADWIPDDDAAVVARLARAGTVLLGKANTHELGGGVTTINPFFGTTHNPRDLSRIPGGSSGGSAAAVVARLALAATGSDTGGSVRIPAAFCGCVGLKPTFGAVDRTGLLGACPTFDHVGVLTRRVDDAARLFAAIADVRDASVPLLQQAMARGAKGLRIGVPRRYFFDDVDQDVATAVTRTLARLEADGASLRDVAFPVTPTTYDTMFAPVGVTEIRATYAKDWATRPESFSKDFAEVFAGDGFSAADVTRARAALAAFQRQVEALFRDVDVLAMPTVPLAAPPIDGAIDGMRILRNTWPFNAARGPAMSVPCRPGPGTLPVGLQLAAAPYGEPRLLRAAAAVERLTLVD